MNDNGFLRNNRVFLMGEAETGLTYSHELYGEGFYEFMLRVPRLSGQVDILPVTVSERLLEGMTVKPGLKLGLNGQFRSYNKLVDERSKLMLTIFVRDFIPHDAAEQNPNAAELNGYICKPPIYRTTPFNREICDVLLAVNRGYNKSDYIPCIAWGRNARFVRGIAVGQNLLITGRIQSRRYNKKLSDDLLEERTAYELSVSKVLYDSAAERESAATLEESAGDILHFDR
ncbi:MAG: single-stranded DNA-binding protein [Clostridiales bacterium]|jgi:hypothetical protein|nr:single-stranded DNA-binding protein [Clostridiales bacterium]